MKATLRMTQYNTWIIVIGGNGKPDRQIWEGANKSDIQAVMMFVEALTPHILLELWEGNDKE